MLFPDRNNSPSLFASESFLPPFQQLRSAVPEGEWGFGERVSALTVSPLPCWLHTSLMAYGHLLYTYYVSGPLSTVASTGGLGIKRKISLEDLI